MIQKTKDFIYALKQKIYHILHYVRLIVRHKYIKRLFLLLALVSIVSVGIKAYFLLNVHRGAMLSPDTRPHIALIEIQGDISDNMSELNIADRVILSLRKAAKNLQVTAIVLRINSPGGDGIQAAQIYREILRQRKQNPSVPVIAVCQAMCASAAYYIAAGCDRIYVNPSSIIGSIGVRASQFGFSGTLKKLGVERRVFAANNSTKLLFDSFSPRNAETDKVIEKILSGMHEEFIKDVKVGRGKRLKDLDKNEKELFSGRVWTGEQALSLGLVDGFASLSSLSRDILKTNDIVEYNIYPKLMTRLSNLFFNFSANNQTNISKTLLRFFFKKL